MLKRYYKCFCRRFSSYWTYRFLLASPLLSSSSSLSLSLSSFFFSFFFIRGGGARRERPRLNPRLVTKDPPCMVGMHVRPGVAWQLNSVTNLSLVRFCPWQSNPLVGNIYLPRVISTTLLFTFTNIEYFWGYSDDTRVNFRQIIFVARYTCIMWKGVIGTHWTIISLPLIWAVGYHLVAP